MPSNCCAGAINSSHVLHRTLTKESIWRQRVAEHADSGLSVRDFCRQHELKESAFYWWRRRLADRDAEQAGMDIADVADHVTQTQASSFVPVRVTEDTLNAEDHSATDRNDDGSRIEIMLTNGRRVRITGLVNRQMLTDVLDVLERRAC